MNYLITKEQLAQLKLIAGQTSIFLSADCAQEFTGILETIEGSPEEETVGGWSAEDAMEACGMHGFTLSVEDSISVLKAIEKQFDASTGMDWDDIWAIAEEMAEDGKIALHELPHRVDGWEIPLNS